MSISVAGPQWRTSSRSGVSSEELVLCAVGAAPAGGTTTEAGGTTTEAGGTVPTAGSSGTRWRSSLMAADSSFVLRCLRRSLMLPLISSRRRLAGTTRRRGRCQAASAWRRRSRASRSASPSASQSWYRFLTSSAAFRRQIPARLLRPAGDWRCSTGGTEVPVALVAPVHRESHGSVDRQGNLDDRCSYRRGYQHGRCCRTSRSGKSLGSRGSVHRCDHTRDTAGR